MIVYSLFTSYIYSTWIIDSVWIFYVLKLPIFECGTLQRNIIFHCNSWPSFLKLHSLLWGLSYAKSFDEIPFGH